MDILTKLLSVFFPFQKNSRIQKPARRSLQIESLESRELLSVNLLAPISAYAQQDNPAEIRFELTTPGSTASKLDFTVHQANGSLLDPSAISLVNRSTGQSVALSNIINGTTSSSAFAQLATGSYSIYVSADAGKGYFTLSIAQDKGNSVKSGLNTLVAAAIAQQLQPSNWASQAKYYNNLLANTEYAGAASALSIAQSYPEVDVNGDRKINVTDLNLAEQLVATGSASATITAHSVVPQDLTPPSITVSLKNDTEIPGDKISTDPTIIGKITDAGGIKSASYKIDNGSWVALSLDANGNYTIPNTGLAYGDHSIIIQANDQKGNSATSAALTFTYILLTPPASLSDNGNGKITVPSNFTVQSIADQNIQSGQSRTLPDGKGTIALASNGTLTLTPGSNYMPLGKGETAILTLPVVLKNAYGNEYTTTVSFTVVGADDPSVLSANQTTFTAVSNDSNNPLKLIDAGFSVTDPDTKDANGAFVYSYSKVKDGSATANTGLIVDFNSANGTFKIDTAKLKNRSVHSVITLDVSVKSVSGGIVTKTLTINFNPVPAPTAPALTISATETTGKTGKAVPTVAGAGFTMTGLTALSATGFGSLPSGVSLASVATLDANGNFVFTPGKNFEYLKQGESLKLKLQYTITDTQYGLTGTGIIELTIAGEATLPTAPNGQTGVIGGSGEFSATETNGTVSDISVPKEKILEDWTLPDGQNAYSIVAGDISFEKWNGGTTNPLGSDSFGSVNVDSAGNLVFTPAAAIYKLLGAGQWIDVAVNVSVRNANGDLVPGGKVLLRINGTNDVPTLGCQQDSGFSFASNSKDAVSIDPGFTKNDPDLNDAPESLVFSIDEASVNLGFIIDVIDGKISVNADKRLSLNGDYKITVTLIDGHGETAAKEITVQFYHESAPVLSDASVSINEKENGSTNLNDAIVKKAGHAYSFSSLPVPTHLSFDNGQTWTALSDSYLDLSNCWNFDAQTGLFEFIPNSQFDFLTEGETLKIKFGYKVSDNGYENSETTGSIVVNVLGINDKPVQNTSEPADYGTVVQSAVPSTKKIDDLLSGWSDADHLNSVLKISGLRIIGSGGNSWISLTDLQNASNLFKISADGRSVEFNTAHEIFRNLPADENLTLTVEYTVADPLNAAGTGLFTIQMTGIHRPINLVSKTEITNPLNVNGLPANGQIAEIRIEFDAIDTLNRSIICVDSDGTVYDNLFTFDENGKIYLDPSKHGTLDLNKTYTVTAVIDNQDYSDDEPITVVYTLNFVRRGAPTIPDSSLTLSLSEKETKSLELRNADGNSYKNESDYSCEITAVNGVTKATLVNGTDYRIENGVFYFIAGHQFDYLAAGTSENLVFSYKITDTAQGNGSDFVEGTISVTINGVNDLPAITGDETFDVTNSGLSAGAAINVGHFNAADIDDGDTLTLSVQAISGTASGEVLETLPVFRIDENGDVTIQNTGLPNLKPGEFATYQVEVKAVDSQGEAVTKKITVTVHAKAKPILNVDQTDWNAAESDQPISKSYNITVQDTAETFAPLRTGNTWYSEPSIAVSVSSEYQGIAGLTNLFKIVGDSVSGYRLTFDADANLFEFLRQNEPLPFTVTITVQDTRYLVETVSILTFTVTGTGNQHTVVTENNSFDYWTNLIGGDQTAFDPKYTITDSDWKETYSYTLSQVAVNTSQSELEEALKSLIQIDPNTGVLTLNKAGLGSLSVTKNISYQLTVRITGGSDGLFEDVVVGLNINTAVAPIVSDISKEINETQSINGETINVTKPDDGAVRDTNWYTAGNLKYLDCEGEIPPSFNISEQALAAANIADGKFSFNPATNFDFLPEGAVLKLRYQITVYDAKFDISATETITVTINGKNSKPGWKADTNLGSANVAADVDGHYLDISIADLVNDADLHDSHTLWSINGTEIVAGETFTIAGKGKFRYQDGVLRYWAVDGELDKLRQGQALNLSFDFVVKDHFGSLSDSKAFTITAIGTNKPPVAVADDIIFTVWKGSPSFTLSAQKDTNDGTKFVATDVNAGDKLRFSQIISAGVPITSGMIMTYLGMTLTLNTELNQITFNPDNYNWDVSGTAWTFSVTVTDDYGATCQKNITIKFEPGTVPAESVPVQTLSAAPVIFAPQFEAPAAGSSGWTAENELLLGNKVQEKQQILGAIFDEETEGDDLVFLTPLEESGELSDLLDSDIETLARNLLSA